MKNIPTPGPSTVTLRSRIGEPLRDETTRRTVVATAQAIAERMGFVVQEIDTTPDSVTVTIDADQLASIGFAAELRTLTTNWYRHKFGIEHLWGRATHETQDDDDADSEDWES